MTYWSGLWATAILMLALAITPAARNIPLAPARHRTANDRVTALAYTIAHIIIYFALRLWDFAFIANEMVTRLSLIVASVSTIGLIALGATSLDAAIARMGAKGWNTLHNTVYAIAALALLHYLLSPGVFPEQYLMSGMFFWLMGWRVLDRHGGGADAGALTLLAVASCLFTSRFSKPAGLGPTTATPRLGHWATFHPRPRPLAGVGAAGVRTSDRGCSRTPAGSARGAPMSSRPGTGLVSGRAVSHKPETETALTF